MRKCQGSLLGTNDNRSPEFAVQLGTVLNTLLLLGRRRPLLVWSSKTERSSSAGHTLYTHLYSAKEEDAIILLSVH